ncbi:oxidoreductase [Rhodococcus sp. 14-2496-1d]|uniref:MDR family oxidoreductase n=1 Tax=Rhodococcus sp. 14-2496-1d TaxID=2023146 RepID=UPI000B9ABDFB|nr:MDR family oxidoreductase [Rhodococcus sp. 14-2496-1d]OZF25680.1 oxidoreductase [Rhodococcus sp. 14-2496-1d]
MTNALAHRAYRVTAPKAPAELVELSESDLADGDLLIRVTHSSLNYKDGLALLGKPGVVRTYPMTCGIDLAGTVVSTSGDSSFAEGDDVVLTGAGLSETKPGGFAGYQRVDSSHVLPAPTRLGTWGAMAVGTAGLTAMLCIQRMQSAGVGTESGPVLVTGATGGVGSFAVFILSRLGYEVHAATGKASEAEYLRTLGATTIVERESLTGEPKALGKQRWAGCIDSVGGVTLANVLAQMDYSGVVAACGLAGGSSLPTTVMPFILRNVSLLGVDSVNASLDLRRAAWTSLDEMFTPDDLREIAVEVTHDELPAQAERILSGAVRGRVVVDTAGLAG